MQLTRFRSAPDWNAGTYSATSLDTLVNVSPFQHPALVAGTAQASNLGYAGARLYLAAKSIITLSETNHPTSLSFPTNVYSSGAAAWTSTDAYAYTTTAGDPFQFTTTAQTVTLFLPGIAVSGAGTAAGQASTPALAMDSSNATHGSLVGLQSGDYTANTIRNGAQAAITVNGTLLGTVDTYATAQGYTIYGLTGTNTIEVYHNGTYNAQYTPWSTVSNITGTSVAGNIQFAAQTHPSPIAAMWRVVMTTGPTWKIQRNTGTPSAPTWTDQVTGLAIGATDSTHVAGVNVTLPSGPTYTVGDTAQFTTDVSMLAIGSIVFGFGSASGNGTYTSPVIDSGSQNTQWFLAEWNEARALGTGNVTFKVGQTATPDGSWTTQAFTASETILPSGARYGVAGLAAASSTLPRARYAQFMLSLPPSLQVQPYVRDLSVYSWVPEQDTTAFSKMGFAPQWVPGPNLSQFVGTLECHLAVTRAYVLDWIASFSRSNAVDAWLQGYGAEYGLTEYTGIPPGSYQAIVASFLKSRPKGGSIPFMQQALALLILGPSGVPSNMTITQGSVGTGSYTINIPPPSIIVAGASYYPGMPGVPTGVGSPARAIISAFVQLLNPLNCAPTLIYNAV